MDHECFDPDIAYTRAELSSFINRSGAFTIVAESPDATSRKDLVGFITINMHKKGYGHIATIDVRKTLRRKGIGALLMEAAEKKVKDLDGFMVVLEVAVDNDAALQFYKKRGYQVVKQLPGYYQNRLDGILMTRRL